tara:strand:+ start:95 stop:694 length:600 start_codon:yes stop_codon:yes gene_type:complete
MANNIQMPSSMETNMSARGPVSISPNISTSEEKSGNIIKIVLIIGGILFLAYNLYLYMTEGKDILEKMFGIKLFSSNKEEKEEKTKRLDVSTDKDSVKLDESQKEVTNETSPIENIMEEKGKHTPELKNSQLSEKNTSTQIQADVSTESEIQQSKKGNYCYIGTDRTYRTCVKMKEDDTCVSKQIFPTLEVCINPKLRT